MSLSRTLSLCLLPAMLGAQALNPKLVTKPGPGPVLALMPILHIKSATIIKAECGQPLRFRVEVQNTGKVPFTKGGWVFFKGAKNQMTQSFDSVPAGGYAVVVQESAALPGDCATQQCYRFTLSNATNGSTALPEWDGKAAEVCTHPETKLVVVPK